MTAPMRPRIGDHYLDSGPLFCLGGSGVLADLFDADLLLNSRVAAAVVGEVHRNAALVLPPVGPHPKRRIHHAARVVRSRYKPLLESAPPVPAPAPQLLASIKADLTARAVAKLRPGQHLHPSANDGEAESVYWAATQSVEVVTNDSDAHQLARKHQVTSSTFVEVVRHLVKAQKVVSRRTIFGELMTLSRRDIFPGEHITSELDLV
ncbi:hypothetical protein [Promicromonospora sp. NFX87]|uniref:hypothetical protein n=1 Tax=Promicromonospora sp. NFX87 TaxID=3402691 RepID=UPI003AFA0656